MSTLTPHAVKATPIGALLGLTIPPAVTIDVVDAPMNGVPDFDPNYVFNLDTVRDFHLWLKRSDPKWFLWLGGPLGTGKTSFIENMAAKLNRPLFTMTGHKRFEISDLISQRTVIGGDIMTVLGPLAQAYRDGGWFLLNEVSRIPPELLPALNDIGGSITIADNGGEVLKPHPDFRFIVTDNTLGGGDAQGLYAGAERPSIEFMDRFYVMSVGYAAPEVEMSILAKAVPGFDDKIAKRLITVATEVRQQFVREEEGMFIPGSLDITISTRALVRWAMMTDACFRVKSIPNPVSYALDRTAARKGSPESRKALLLHVQSVFGPDERNPPV